MKRDRILFFPDFSAGNPYQRLLYGPAVAAGMTVAPGSIETALAEPDPRRVIFHLHWLHPLFAKARDATQARASVDYLEEMIVRFRAAGGFVIWTIHNHKPHRDLFPDEDMRLRKLLCALADRIHLHHESHLRDLAVLPIPPAKVVVQAHGSYIGHYGPFTLDDRLSRLGVEPLRALFFGSLRPYKDIDALMSTAQSLVEAGIPVTIAGRPDPQNMAADVAARARDIGAETILERITDADLHALCSTHDIGLLSYRRSLTSGTLKLYLGYAMVIVAPPLPTLMAEDRFGTFVYTGAGAPGPKLREMPVAQIREAMTRSRQLADEAHWRGALFKT